MKSNLQEEKGKLTHINTRTHTHTYFSVKESKDKIDAKKVHLTPNLKKEIIQMYVLAKFKF